MTPFAFPRRLTAMGLGVTILSLGTLPAIPADTARSYTATLPNITLAEAQNSVLRGTIANDRQVMLAGTGSDLWVGPTDLPGEFWMVTDRGPNGQIRVDGANRRTFPVPEFTPLILRVRMNGAALSVQEIIPLTGRSGQPITGMSNLAEYDELPYDWAADKTFPFNQSGLDTEGLVRTRTGDFWLVDEYSPSLVKVDRTGRVVKRFIPANMALPQADYQVVNNLPGIYSLRKGNRGFEGLALSHDEKTLYIALQSPLGNPNRVAGETSRNTRILGFDIASEKVTGEWVYRFDDYREFDAAIADDMKISSVVAINATTLLINERTDAVAKLYLADLSRATNILGSAWDDTTTRPTLEQVNDLASAGVTEMAKTLVINLDTIPGMPDKIEGVAVLNQTTIAVANDNDFGLGTFDARGNLVSSGVPNQIVIITLDTPLP